MGIDPNIENALAENRKLNQLLIDHVQLVSASVSALLHVLFERDVGLQRKYQAKFQEIIQQQGGLSNQLVLAFLAEAFRKYGRTN